MKDKAYYDQVLARLYKEERHQLKSYEEIDEDIPDAFLEMFMTSDQRAGVKPPPLEKAIPEGAKTIALPPIDEISLGGMPLIQAFKKRRSHRQFSEDPLSLEELTYLCWSVAGVHQIGPNEVWTKRTSPSGGARHPFETYLVIQRVQGLDPGIYRYSGLQNRLALVKSGDGFCEYLGAEAMQSFVKESAVVFIWTVIPYRNEWRYMYTSAREMAMDIGHYCENLYLAAESIGAGTCGVASYRQKVVDELLGVDGEDEFTLYIAPVGKIKE